GSAENPAFSEIESMRKQEKIGWKGRFDFDWAGICNPLMLKLEEMLNRWRELGKTTKKSL
ncbi:hypothetical protein N8639_01630, partial [bacterium]|nr:hypothetical protein [bacterium]